MQFDPTLRGGPIHRTDILHKSFKTDTEKEKFFGKLAKEVIKGTRTPSELRQFGLSQGIDNEGRINRILEETGLATKAKKDLLKEFKALNRNEIQNWKETGADLSRSNAENLLKDSPDGTYLLRRSSNAQAYVVTVKIGDGEYSHHKIDSSEGNKPIESLIREVQNGINKNRMPPIFLKDYRASY